jgi:hypothetical protein
MNTFDMARLYGVDEARVREAFKETAQEYLMTPEHFLKQIVNHKRVQEMALAYLD